MAYQFAFLGYQGHITPDIKNHVVHGIMQNPVMHRVSWKNEYPKNRTLAWVGKYRTRHNIMRNESSP